ncbi:MAG: hypothetical protein MHPSP_000908 [Paramarteilia canceri]
MKSMKENSKSSDFSIKLGTIARIDSNCSAETIISAVKERNIVGINDILHPILKSIRGNGIDSFCIFGYADSVIDLDKISQQVISEKGTALVEKYSSSDSERCIKSLKASSAIFKIINML